MARLSLSEVVRILMDREPVLKLAVADPLVRRLIVAYVAALDPGDFAEETAGQQSTIMRVIAAVLSQPAPPPGPARPG